MRKDDARKLDHKTLEEMRMRAVKRIQDGESPEIIARVLGVDRSTVYGWLARYLVHAPASEQPGKNLLLLPKAIAQICRLNV